MNDRLPTIDPNAAWQLPRDIPAPQLVAPATLEAAALAERARIVQALATAFQAIENPYDDRPEAHVFEQGVLRCFAALRALSSDHMGGGNG